VAQTIVQSQSQYILHSFHIVTQRFNIVLSLSLKICTACTQILTHKNSRKTTFLLVTAYEITI